ncbi:tRNA (adenosine(37)-N6)-threonylcarbamoyltransferase complex dimerization subunit type 1 TsaB [Hutsoniella sourekii]
MRVLGVDTSAEYLSIYLGQGSALDQLNLVKQVHSKEGRQHGVSLLPNVAQLLEEVTWTRDSITDIVVGVGPGSYTGLRIGVTMAKVWADTASICLYGISSLGLMAANSPTDEPAKTAIIPIMDARRLSAYLGVYQWQDGRLVNLLADCHVDWLAFQDSLDHLLTKTGIERLIFVGEGIEDFIDCFDLNYSYEYLSGNQSLANFDQGLARGLAQLADQPGYLNPNYAHATLAEQEWAQKHNKEIADDKTNEAFIDRHF